MTSNFRLTVLVDNTADAGLVAEHGFALWIETPQAAFLLDTGQGSALPDNIERLGFDPAVLRGVILSHGHYDHAGGLAWVLDHAPRATLFLHPAAKKARYALRTAPARDIAMPASVRERLDALDGRRRVHVRSSCCLTPHLLILGGMERDPDPAENFFLDPGGRVPDRIEDDISLCLRLPRGGVLLCGCCHSGIETTLGSLRRAVGALPLLGVIGGLHTMHSGREEHGRIIESLRREAPEWIVPGHCTGEKMTALLQKAFGNRVLPGRAGLSFDPETGPAP